MGIQRRDCQIENAPEIIKQLSPSNKAASFVFQRTSNKRVFSFTCRYEMLCSERNERSFYPEYHLIFSKIFIEIYIYCVNVM